MKLYEIDDAINAILEAIDPETGELLDTDFDALNCLQMARDSKIENVALRVKNLKAEAVAYKAEKDAFAKREKAASRAIEGFERWLVFALNGQKFTAPRCAVTFRQSERVEISDESAIPKDFMKETISYTPNKTAIKQAIKGGAEIGGCSLVAYLNPTIK